MYSVSNMKSDGKPPLAKSPMRLRPRRVLRPSNSFSLQTPPPPGWVAESKRGMGWEGVEECELRPEYRTISCELRALTNMVREELGKRDRDGENNNIAFGNGVEVGVDSHSHSHSHRGTLFERGRLYDAYSAKRNERLKRKKTGGDDVKAAAYNYSHSVGVAAECRSTKKVESLRKSMQAEPPRYMLRSRTKGDNNLNPNLPPLPPSNRSSSAAPGVHNKIGGSTSRLRRI